MKYGETLRQRSIPAWSHYNIDYDDIKHFIKDRTTAKVGQAVTVPGRGDEKLVEFENALFHILEDQHSRIDSFVKSKAGEIQRRLDHARKQVNQLSRRDSTTSGKSISIGRLEKYSRLENDVLKAGDEIKSLARFTSTQRTAFRKLLKKYKKWTGSTNLEIRFRDEVLNDANSFTKLDLGPFLDEYSETLQSIRTLYDARVQQASAPDGVSHSSTAAEPSAMAQLQSTLVNRSKVDLDTAIASVPLGKSGALAYYFVHPDNVVELQVLLLQSLEYFTPRGRSNSAAAPVSESDVTHPAKDADYYMLIADDLQRFARQQSAVTVNDREHHPGLPPQGARVLIRWNPDEDAVLSSRSGAVSRIRSARMKKKYIQNFFNKDAPLPSQKKEDLANNISAIREEILKDPEIRPLCRVSSCRSRFVGQTQGAHGITIATLDTNISMSNTSADDGSRSDFPFAVLFVRQEGTVEQELIPNLDQSHLVERVRGFSLQYHAMWQRYKPTVMSPPFWMPILSRDIRKLPPPALKPGGSSTAVSSGSQSAARQSISIGEGTTAVETAGQSSSTVLDKFETPPLRSFRKKRRRTYAEHSAQRQQNYWSEYDHPEDGVDEGDAFVLYIDPNEKTILDRWLEKLGGVFGSRRLEEDALLPSPTTPTTPKDDETSSDEEQATVRQNSRSYGTVSRQPFTRSRSSQRQRDAHLDFLPPITSICLTASMALLIVAYILASTSKHKYATEVDAGILFAVGCSLTLAVVGVIPMLARRDRSWISLGVAVTVLIFDALFSGGLLAWILG